MNNDFFSLRPGTLIPRTTWLLYHNNEQIATFTSHDYALMVVGLLNSHINDERVL